jgi:hypothetical protein
MVTTGLVLMGLAILFAFFPRVLVYPLIVIMAWISVALLYRGYKLHSRKHEGEKPEGDSTDTVREERG